MVILAYHLIEVALAVVFGCWLAQWLAGLIDRAAYEPWTLLRPVAGILLYALTITGLLALLVLAERVRLL